jgi:hypothetical protein
MNAFIASIIKYGRDEKWKNRRTRTEKIIFEIDAGARKTFKRMLKKRYKGVKV